MLHGEKSPHSGAVPVARRPVFAGIAGLFALLVSMSIATAQTAPGGADVPPPRFSAVPVPEEQIDRALAGLDTLVADVLERTGIPGLAVSVVRDGKTAFARGFGQRRVGEAAPVDADTVFLLASLSKPVGATVIASQVAHGLVDWDTPVASLLPWFALSDDWVTRHVTIGDLYAHRSGLPDHAGDDLEDLGYDRMEILKRLALLPLHPFRAHYAYTNFGLTAAAEAVAVAAGTDWAELSRQALYAPLGMAATSSLHADYSARANRASSHILKDGRYVVADLRQPDAQSPAGGVSSSANDMAKWMTLILAEGSFGGREVIARKALLPAVTAQVISAPSTTMDARAGAYGFGFGVGTQPSGRVTLSHSGAFALGAGTSVSMIPSLGIGIVVLTNAAPVGAAEAVSQTFADQVQFGRQTRDWLAAFQPRMASLTAPVGSLVGQARPQTPQPHRDAAAYIGVYKNPYFGDAKVVERAGGLALVVGPNQQAEPLAPWSGDTFTYAPFNENAAPGTLSRVTFKRFERDEAQEMTVEYFEQSGFGAFNRQTL